MRTRRLAVAMGLSALFVTALAAEDVLTSLGVRPEHAKIVLLEVISSGRPYHEVGKEAFVGATADVRAAMINGALAWAKQYSESPEFATKYAALRAAVEPRYRPNTAKWEEEYPANARTAIQKRLREFLALSATVDFGAKLVPCKNSSRSCFADPTYETKPSDWKRLYRAGKQPVEAARAFATNWLRELEKR